jgi:exosome complex RNA-binding protein Csl4
MLATPGVELAKPKDAKSVVIGPGVYYDGKLKVLRASIIGDVSVSSTQEVKKYCVTNNVAYGFPQIGQVVIGRVVHISMLHSQATLLLDSIQVSGSYVPCYTGQQGTIKQPSGLKVGNLVRGRVVSLGLQGCFLDIHEAELGVLNQ